MLIIMLKIKEKQSFKNKNSGSCYQWHQSVVGQLGPSPGTNELPTKPKNLKIRPMGYFFKLRSILMLPGLEIPLKSEKISKNWIYKKVGFQKMLKNRFELMSLYSFSRRIRISSPNHPKTTPKPDFDQIFKKSDFYKNRQKSPGGGTGREAF